MFVAIRLSTAELCHVTRLIFTHYLFRNINFLQLSDSILERNVLSK